MEVTSCPVHASVRQLVDIALPEQVVEEILPLVEVTGCEADLVRVHCLFISGWNM